MVHPYMQSIESLYLQFRKKCNIRNAEEQKYISLLSAIDVYD